MNNNNQSTTFPGKNIPSSSQSNGIKKKSVAFESAEVIVSSRNGEAISNGNLSITSSTAKEKTTFDLLEDIQQHAINVAKSSSNQSQNKKLFKKKSLITTKHNELQSQHKKKKLVAPTPGFQATGKSSWILLKGVLTGNRKSISTPSLASISNNSSVMTLSAEDPVGLLTILYLRYLLFILSVAWDGVE